YHCSTVLYRRRGRSKWCNEIRTMKCLRRKRRCHKIPKLVSKKLKRKNLTSSDDLNYTRHLHCLPDPFNYVGEGESVPCIFSDLHPGCYISWNAHDQYLAIGEQRDRRYVRFVGNRDRAGRDVGKACGRERRRTKDCAGAKKYFWL